MRIASLALGALFALAACPGRDDSQPTPTGSTCPSDSTLTYDNFGAPFMDAYCTRCHSSELVGGDRHGAPSDRNFDTLEGIIDSAERIDKQAAAGPDAVNTFMPRDGGDAPSEEERRDLGEWLACELARP